MKTFLKGLFLLLLFSTPCLSQGIKEVDKTVPLDADGRLLIDNHKGSINVSTWDRPEAEIHVRIEPGGDSRREEEWVQQTEIRIDSSPDRVHIETDYDHLDKSVFSFWDSGSSPYVHYSIKMPRTARLDIEDHKSDITVAGLDSELRLDTHKGEVEIKKQHGPVILETHKGYVRVEFAEFTEDSDFDTHKGEIEITLPKQSKFDLQVDLNSRAELNTDFQANVSLNKLFQSRDNDDHMEFRTEVNGGGPRLLLSSHKGYFRLKGE